MKNLLEMAGHMMESRAPRTPHSVFANAAQRLHEPETQVRRKTRYLTVSYGHFEKHPENFPAMHPDSRAVRGRCLSPIQDDHACPYPATDKAIAPQCLKISSTLTLSIYARYANARVAL